MKLSIWNLRNQEARWQHGLVNGIYFGVATTLFKEKDGWHRELHLCCGIIVLTLLRIVKCPSKIF
jgi:hypothetical protein